MLPLLLLPGVVLPLQLALAIPMTDGFDYPVGKPNAGGYYDAQGFGDNGHLGEDWNGNGGGNTDYGDPVYTASNGLVAVAGDYGSSGGWGKVIMVWHDTPEGIRTTMYAHLSEMDVVPGQEVSRGQQIGRIGDCGGRYYAHLHFELRLSDNTANGRGYGSPDQGQTSPSDYINARRPPWPPSPPNVTTFVSESSSSPSEGSPGFWRHGTTGYWEDASIGDGGHMYWVRNNDAAHGIDNMGDWRPNLPESRYYEVYAYIPSNNATTTDAQYEIYHADGRTDRHVSQLSYSNEWVSLGTYRFSAGSGNYVRLIDRTSEGYLATKIGFDAVKWEARPDPVPGVGAGSSDASKFIDEYNRHGGHDVIGDPRATVNSWGVNVPEIQHFTGGGAEGSCIMWNRSTAEAYWVHGAIYAHYMHLDDGNHVNGPDGLGCAISDEVSIGPSPFGLYGVYQEYLKQDGGRGVIFHNFGSVPNEDYHLYGRHWQSYKAFGGPYSYLGWPRVNPSTNGTDQWAAYEKGWTTRDSEAVIFSSDDFPVPSTTCAIVGGTPGQNGWYTTPVTLQLRPDICSVDRHWRYAGDAGWTDNPPVRGKGDWNPAATGWVDHTGQPIVIGRTGTMRVEYYSAMTQMALIAGGGARPTEATKSLELKIDTSVPVSGIVFSPPAGAPVGTAVSLHITCSDDASGFAGGELWINRDAGGGTPDDQWAKVSTVSSADSTISWDTTGWAIGQHVVRVSVSDNAGNSTHTDLTYSLQVPPPAPTVASATYLNTTHVDVLFSESLDKTTAETAGNYGVSPSLGVTGASLDEDGRTVHLTMATQAGGTTYHMTVSGVKSAAGTVIVSGSGDTASWTTPTAPTVVSKSPTGSAAAVSSNVQVTFSTAMNQSATQTAVGIAPSVDGTYSWSADGKTLTFDPTANLAYSTMYTVTISTEARDLAGTQLEATATWSFTTAVAPVTFRKSYSAGLWMMGLPATPASPDAEQVVGTDKVVCWNAVSQQYQYYTSTPFNMCCGAGYWARFTSATQVSFQGYGPTGSVSSSVSTGWNLLGNPTNATMPWSRVTATGSVDAFGWGQNTAGTGYVLLSTITGLNSQQTVQPWGGFWLHADAGGQVSVGTSSARETSSVQDLASWVIRLSATTAGAVDEDNFVGVARAASDISTANPPSMGDGYVDLYMVDGTSQRRAVDILGAGQRQAWDLVVETNLAGSEVQVRFPDLSSVPADLSLRLTDLDTGHSLNLRTTSLYRFTAGAGLTQRHLRLEACPRSQGAALLTAVSTQPTAAGVQIAYSLSASAEVGIEVRNMAGRMIAVIPQGSQEAGTHTAVWTRRASSGTRVPNGQYLLSVRSYGEDGTQTDRIVPVTVR